MSLQLLLLVAITITNAQTWMPVPLQNPNALCLDGSRGAYQVKLGLGENITKVILFFQGGGWAMSPNDLLYRSKTALGSTVNDVPNDMWSEEDLLTDNTARNPHFATWTSIGLRYCCGSSFSSHLDMPFVVNSTSLHLRGHDILTATIDQLLSSTPGGGASSLSEATEVIVAGGSAGGLSVYLHLDYIASRIHAVNPGVSVVGIANDGFFIDGASIWNGRHFFTQVFQRVVSMGNITTPAQVNSACMAAKQPQLQWQCFLAEYTLPYLVTRLFIFNSFQDQYQAWTMLSPNISSADAPGGVTEWDPFVPCTHAPWNGCNATQYVEWQGMGGQFLTRVRAAAAATSIAHGAFISSCPTHGTCINDRCQRITLSGGQHPMSSLLDWYADKGAKPGQYWLEDTQWPVAWDPSGVTKPNPTCDSPW
jgi:hypothetical protein